MTRSDEDQLTPIVIVFDILGLREVNCTLGNAEGDARIRDLAQAVQEKMPEECSFYRGHEADIIAVCEHQSENDLMDRILSVADSNKSPVLFGIGSGVAGSPASNEKSCKILMRAFEEAQLDLRIKKMLNLQSNRSQALTSLIRALEEVDADTQEHVKRTQKTGLALGRRIGLSDLQLSLLQRKDGTVIQVVCHGERYFDSSVRAYRSTLLVFEAS